MAGFGDIYLLQVNSYGFIYVDVCLCVYVNMCMSV